MEDPRRGGTVLYGKLYVLLYISIWTFERSHLYAYTYMHICVHVHICIYIHRVKQQILPTEEFWSRIRMGINPCR